MRWAYLVFGLTLTFSSIAQAQDTKLLKELEEKDDLFLEEEAGPTGLETLLDDIVITATKRAQPISAAPAIISVITDRQIAQRGYKTVAEALASIPGLYLLTDHVQYNLGIRGVNGGMRAGSRIVKVMIDGQPVSFRPTTENWLGEELIPISAVRRIEVIRGPSSALYGANAFLGVVNIITVSGSLVDGGKVTTEIGAVQKHLSAGGNIIAGKKSGNYDFVIAGGGSYTDRSGLIVANVPEQNTYNSLQHNDQTKKDTTTPASIFAKLQYYSNLLGNLSLDFNYQRLNSIGEFADWGPLAMGRQVDSINTDQRNQVSLQNLYARGRVTKTFMEDFNLALSSTFSMMGPTNDDWLWGAYRAIGDYILRDFGTTGLDVASEVSYTLKSINTFAIGVDYTSDWHQLLNYYAYTHPLTGGWVIMPRGEELLGQKNFQNVGTYFQSIIYPFSLFSTTQSYSDMIGLTLGIRYDHHNIYGDAVNYRAGSVVQLNRKLSAKILFGTSFKAPASVQLFSQLLQPGDVLANPNLKPEKAKTVEFLLGGEIISGLNATLNAFYSWIDDKVEIVLDRTTTNSTAKNISNITSWGGEGDLTYSNKGLSSYFNFSYEKTTSQGRNQLTGNEVTLDAQLYPSFMLKFGAGYQLTPFHVGTFLEGQYITSRLSSSPNAKNYDPINEMPYSLDSYFIMNLVFTSVDLTLLQDRETFMQFKIGNLMNKRYLYPGFRDFDIPALGRSYLFTIAQQF